MNNLNFYYKCDQLILNCVLKPVSLEFALNFANSSNNLSFNKFDYLCHLDLNFYSRLEIFDKGIVNDFKFLLISKNTEKKNSHSNVLKSEIFDLLFQNSTNLDKVLLISPSDGFVYWYPIQLTKKHVFSTKLNNFVLCNVNDKVIIIETFKLNDLVNPLEALISADSKSDTSKKCHNCLFIVTKAGRVLSYSYQSSITFKVSVLPHSVVLCIRVKYSKSDYLIYCTHLNEIFGVLLEDVIQDSSPKSIFLAQGKSIKKLKKEADKVYYVETTGKVFELNLKASFANEKYKNSSDSCDLQMVNTLLEKLSIKSSKIVEGQLLIDRLNSTIKQLSILQANRHGFCNNFEITKKIKNHKIELTIKNKNVLLEDNNNCYSILCCIRYEKLNGNFHRAFIWQNNLEQFNATKAATEQFLIRDATQFIKINMFPAQLKLFLIFNIQKFLHSNISLVNSQVKFDKEMIEKIGDFCVPIYGSYFSINDLLLPVNCSEKMVEPSYNMLMNMLQKENLFEDEFRINNVWTCLEIEGYLGDLSEVTDSKRNLSFSNLELSLKKTNEEKALLKFEIKVNNKKNKFFLSLPLVIYAKNCLVFQNVASRNAYATSKLEISQNKLLESIACKIEDLVERKNCYMDNERRMEASESFSQNKPNKFYSIETLLNLVQIYINLRQILSSKIEIEFKN